MRRPVLIAGKPQVRGQRVITASRCLPDTITVSLSGFADAHPDTHRVALTLTACQGTGGTGYATAPKPDDPPGALSDAVVEDGGSGHAALGRVAPTLTGDGNATATVTVTEDDTGPCGWPVWRVSAVSVTTPGSAIYTDNAAFYVGYGGEVTAVAPAALRVRTYRDVPTLTIDDSGASGTGAAITLTTTAGTDFEGRDAWSATGYTIDTDGTGYAVDDLIQIGTSDGVQIFGGLLRVTSVGGSGEITGLSIDDGGQFFLDTGEANDVEIDDGGEYYTEDAGEPVLLASVTVTPDSEGTGQTFTVDINDDPLDANFGRIEGITVTNGGTGHSATINSQPGCGAAFDGKTFVLKRLECQAGGNDGLPPLPVVIGDSLQFWPYHDQPLDDTPDLDQFPTDPEVPLRETVTWNGRCFYAHLFCTGLSTDRARRGGVFAVHRGDGLPPVVVVAGNSGLTNLTAFGPNPRLATECDVMMQAAAAIDAEAPFEFTATSAAGETAVVTEGGTYDPYAQFDSAWSCASCCKGSDAVPAEVSVDWAPEPAYVATTPAAGTYVLPHDPETDDPTGTLGHHLRWRAFDITARIVPCRGVEIYTDTAYPYGRKCWQFMEGCVVFFQVVGYSNAAPDEGDCDARCLPVPMCAPPAGSYPVYHFDGTDFNLAGTVTVS